MKTVKVAAAVIRRDGKYFAAQRGYGEYKDWWEFPGGKIEEGETPEEALRREIREELDTVIEVGNRLITVEYDYPAFHLSMDCFFCKVVEGNLTLKEAEDARWLSFEQLGSVNWLPADLAVVEKIRENKKLFDSQKELLDTFLENHAITEAQYAKSFGTLKEKMGF